MKKFTFLVLAIVGLSISSFAETGNDNSNSQTRVSTQNGITTVTTQQTIESSKFDTTVNNTIATLKSAFTCKAVVKNNESFTTYDFKSPNGHTARFVVDKENNKLLLITKRSEK